MRATSKPFTTFCLQLEITESALLEDIPSVTRALAELRQLGVGLALDDFGTGYSALSYLWRFPIDTIKLDCSFVIALGDDARSAAVVRAVTGLAQELGMAVTAEGIETATQRDYLRSFGCRRGQGFYFSRPLPAAVLATLLEAAHRGHHRNRPRRPAPSYEPGVPPGDG